MFCRTANCRVCVCVWFDKYRTLIDLGHNNRGRRFLGRACLYACCADNYQQMQTYHTWQHLGKTVLEAIRIFSTPRETSGWAHTLKKLTAKLGVPAKQNGKLLHVKKSRTFLVWRNCRFHLGDCCWWRWTMRQEEGDNNMMLLVK